MPARIRRGQTLEEVHATCSGASASTGTTTASSSSSSSSAPSQATHPAASLASINSAFQVQEYIALLVRSDPHRVARIVAVPDAAVASPDFFAGGEGAAAAVEASKGKGREGEGEGEGEGQGQREGSGGAEGAGGAGSAGGGPSQHVDTDVWVYEQLRRIVQDLTTPWLTALLGACSKTTSPETCGAMNAGDWLYVCASHGEDRQCCAIDYIVHTVDGTAALLNNPRHFPGRTYIPNASLRQFGSIARRLSRIFVHAHGHHRDVFEECEAQTSLYARFVALNALYELISTESLPPLDAEAARRAGLAPGNASSDASPAASAASSTGRASSRRGTDKQDEEKDDDKAAATRPKEDAFSSAAGGRRGETPSERGVLLLAS